MWVEGWGWFYSIRGVLNHKVLQWKELLDTLLEAGLLLSSVFGT